MAAPMSNVDKQFGAEKDHVHQLTPNDSNTPDITMTVCGILDEIFNKLLLNYSPTDDTFLQKISTSIDSQESQCEFHNKRGLRGLH